MTEQQTEPEHQQVIAYFDGEVRPTGRRHDVAVLKVPFNSQALTDARAEVLLAVAQFVQGFVSGDSRLFADIEMGTIDTDMHQISVHGGSGQIEVIHRDRWFTGEAIAHVFTTEGI